MSQHKYVRLLTRLIDTPLLINSTKLATLTEKIAIPLMFGQADDIVRTEVNATKYEILEKQLSAGNKVGIIEVTDSLVSKEVSAASGMTSYQRIASQIDGAVARGFTTIGFDIDSPGGEASGLFGLTEKIRQLSTRGIRTFAFIDNATSAAYAIAAATQKVYSSEIAMSGSIAALMVHRDTVKADEEAGFKYTIFQSKELKALGHPHESLSEAATEKMTSILASLDSTFNNDIVKSRPALSIDAIIGMKGASFTAEESLQLNLVDAIVPNMETALADFFKTTTSPKNQGVKMSESDLATQLEAAQSTIVALETSLATQLADAVSAERARCLSVLKNQSTLNLSLDSALSHISKGYSAEQSLEMMTDTRAEFDRLRAIDTSTSGSSTVGLDDPLQQDKTSRTEFLRSSYKAAKGL
jgi:ClpP class serine protease